MTYSGDLRWWAMVLIFLYGMDAEMVGDIMGASERTVRRWLEFL
jgi:transposase